MITPLPGAIALKPGSATLPFFRVEPVLLDADGQELERGFRQLSDPFIVAEPDSNGLW